MITGINDSKTLTKHISYECKCRFDGEKKLVKINDGILINVYVSVKTFMYFKKIVFGILLYVFVKIKNIQQVSWMIQQLSEMKLQSHTIKKKILMKRKQYVKQRIAVSIYCYLRKTKNITENIC